MVVREDGFVQVFWLGDERFGDLVWYDRTSMGVEDGVEDLEIVGVYNQFCAFDGEQIGRKASL